ncbi:aminotransferase class I and II [Pseudoxanthomonas suwonensis 11-1]|uniref:Aminotransferase class I and II n=1 Tax=Pseudoxanthomonas suwonensis (strain 11-1) TaxID=743721 RepID=E6WTS8_PSEUU|nr:pyridoxal phosphate-dependent aminotransferase [Pseudoxanthomonas suwonensis]ADV27577.1 aminotransferase class I and II [Pseudoxanthomonas suwonensis 11-1]
MSPVSRRTFLRGSGLAAAGLATGVLPGTVMALPPPLPAAGADGSPVLLNFNECPLGPSPAAQEAARAILPRGGRYQFGLRGELAAEFARQQGLPVDHVAVYAGSSEPLDRAALAFTGPDRSLVLPDPTFEAVADTAAAHGARVHRVPLLADGSHDVRAMAAAATDAGLLYACNPNNPTGSVTARGQLEWLLANRPAGSVLLVDEAYIEYSGERSMLDHVRAGADLVVLRTFSKIYGMAGMRLGLALGRPDLLAKLAAFGSNPLPVTALAAGLASLRDPGLVPERRQANALIREQAIAWLQARGYPCLPSQANCFMVDVGSDGKAFSAAMADRGVLIGRAWPVWPTRVRVTVGTAGEMARFREVFAQLAPARSAAA